MRRVLTVLKLLRNAEVALWLSKCSFFDTTASYLGHSVRPRELVVVSESCAAVCKFLPLTSKTEIKPLSGVRSACWGFVRSFVSTAGLLNIRALKNHLLKFEVGVAKLDAFQKLKQRLMFSPAQALPRH